MGYGEYEGVWGMDTQSTKFTQQRIQKKDGCIRSPQQRIWGIQSPHREVPSHCTMMTVKPVDEGLTIPSTKTSVGGAVRLTLDSQLL